MLFFQNSVFLPFAWLGLFVITVWFIKWFYILLRTLYYFILQTFEFHIDWKSLRKWAVITGGSDGIGRAYAKELAKRGLNILIIGRTPEKLETVVKEISETFFVDTKAISADFTGGPEIYDLIKKELQDLDIGVLVNNVGMSYNYAEYLHAVPDGENVLNNIIQSNIVACTMMIKMVLPQMVERKSGVIINISSLTALYPMPLLNVYSASKAYVDYLSRALQLEYASKGIIIQSVLPGYVATKMSNRRISIEIPSADTFVKCAIGTVGLENYTYGYFPHKIRGFAHEWLKNHMPERVNMAIAVHFMSKSRERYYRRIHKKRKTQE